MIKSIEDLAHIDETGSIIYPQGPCSAWPQSRNVLAPNANINYRKYKETRSVQKTPQVKASAGQMVAGMMSTAAKAVTTGKVSAVERDQRFEKCKHCSSFIQQSERCSECGCFMAAKTWIRGATCPLKKW